MILEVFLGTVAIFVYLLWKLTKNRNHWDSRNVPNTGFKFLFGDDKGPLLRTRTAQDTALDLYKQFDGQSYYGTWSLFGQPLLNVRNDFDLIRAVWIKDFDHFAMTRGEAIFKLTPLNRMEKIAMSHLARVHGEQWKDLRWVVVGYTSFKVPRLLSWR